jgi:hypothetical protein
VGCWSRRLDHLFTCEDSSFEDALFEPDVRAVVGGRLDEPEITGAVHGTGEGTPIVNVVDVRIGSMFQEELRHVQVVVVTSPNKWTLPSSRYYTSPSSRRHTLRVLGNVVRICAVFYQEVHGILESLFGGYLFRQAH